MFYLDWELSLIVMVIFPAIMGLSSIFSRYVKEYSKKYQEMIADSTIIAEECFLNIKTVKSFAQEESEILHFKDTLSSAYSTAVKKAVASGIYKCSIGIITYISNLNLLLFYLTFFWY
jgi:ABC-type multidrug transport system fused ATPase/permease subunit